MPCDFQQHLKAFRWHTREIILPGVADVNVGETFVACRLTNLVAEALNGDGAALQFREETGLGIGAEIRADVEAEGFECADAALLVEVDQNAAVVK